MYFVILCYKWRYIGERQSRLLCDRPFLVGWADYTCGRSNVANAARDLVAKRDAWLNPPGASEAELKKRTPTNLYNARPEWLKLNHRKLDEAVLAAYGWPADLTDEELLSRLLALNLERAG